MPDPVPYGRTFAFEVNDVSLTVDGVPACLR